MKVLQITNSLFTGGAEKLLIDTIPLLNARGLRVDVLLLNGQHTIFYEILNNYKNISIFSLGKNSVYNPFHVFRIIPYLKKYDIIHVHLFPSLYWVAIAKLLSFSKTKIVYTEHSTHNRRRNSQLFKLIDRFIYSQYVKIIAISTEVKLHIKKHLQFKNNRFITILNGVNLEVINEAPPLRKEDFKIHPDDTIIIQVARFTSIKNHETLIKSICFIKYPVHLILVGDGVLLERMKELVQLIGIEDKVTFLGTRNDVPNLLAMSDIAVLSSNYEGLSLSGIEAMASGIPLVASKVEGLNTLVYGAGLLFKNNDVVDLANTLNNLIEDPNLYSEVSDKCLQRSKRFHLDNMITEYIKLYKLYAKT